MGLFKINFSVLLLLYCTCHLISAKYHGGSGHHERPEDQHEEDDDHHFEHDDRHFDDDDGEYCMYFRIDHETKQSDVMFCSFGCCGTLDDQRCCDDPDKEEEEERYRHLIRGVVLFVIVLLVISSTCCVFGIYKYKKANLRKTSPGRHYPTTVQLTGSSPYAIFHTPVSGKIQPHKPTNGMKKLSQYSLPDSDPTLDRITSPPPSYTARAEPVSDLPPYTTQSPPPPYSFNIRPVAPVATDLRNNE